MLLSCAPFKIDGNKIEILNVGGSQNLALLFIHVAEFRSFGRKVKVK
jgi:hypothetical protein